MGVKPLDHPLVTLVDVERAMREVERAHCCNMSIELHHPERDGTPVVFWVKVTATPRIVGRRTIRAPACVSHRWPTSECRYVEALMLRLVYKLDHNLDEVGHVPAEQAQFPWDVAS